MKRMKRIMNALRERARERRQAKENLVYYDNYTMLGSILGGYCGMLRFDKKQR